MDLREFAPSEDGALMEVKSPTGDVLQRDGKTLCIQYTSRDSVRWRKAEQAATNRRLKTAAVRQGRAIATAAELEADRIENVAAVTLAWGEKDRDGKFVPSPFTLDGESLECTPDNARRLYREFPFIFEQGEEFATNRDHFLKGGSAT